MNRADARAAAMSVFEEVSIPARSGTNPSLNRISEFLPRLERADTARRLLCFDGRRLTRHNQSRDRFL